MCNGCDVDENISTEGSDRESDDVCEHDYDGGNVQ